jgi:hypothetical protein
MSSESETCPWCGSAISRADFERITAEIRAEEQQRLKERELTISQRLEKKFQDSLEEERRKATKTALEGAQQHKKTLDELRATLDREHKQELARQRADQVRDKENLLKKVEHLERQLKKQTSNELGDGAEIDLYETLRQHFPDDRIKRVQKGQTGADIHQQIVYKDTVCGLIVFDSKNRQAWQRNFATKLLEDQVAANADHAVLTTTVFPAGARHVHLEDGVIVVHPQGAIHVVSILRNAVIRLHTRGLSQKERKGKMEDLYRLLTSSEHQARFQEATRLTTAILELDVQEKKAHDAVWKKRGRDTTRLQQVLSDIESEIASIIERPGGAPVAHAADAF